MAQSAESAASNIATSQEPVGTLTGGMPVVALRADDVERATWFIEDLAVAFGQIAAAENNKHAKAAWLVLEENYRAAAQTLDRLRRDRRILMAELTDGEEAAVRNSVVLIDGTLDGAWPAERLEEARQVGGDDWALISQLSSILMQQLGTFRSFDDWVWFKRHLRQSGSLKGPAEALDPALAAELIRFAHIEDKYLLAAIRSESAPTRPIAKLWRLRQQTLAGEAEDFVLRHAAAFNPSSAARFARAWREYADSAKQAATAYARVTFTAPAADLEADGAAVSEWASQRPDRRWPALGSLIDAVPERIKSRATVAAEPALPAAEEPAAAEIPAAEATSLAPDVAEPAVVEADVAKPAADVAEADVAEAAAVEPDTAEPQVAAPAEEPSVAEPTPAPLVAETAAPEPEVAEPAAVETEVAAAAPPASEVVTPEPVTEGPDAADQLALSELVQRAVEDEQAEEWRESLSRETFQANGVTVPIRDETTKGGSLPLTALESSVEPAAGAQQDLPAEGETVVRLQPLQPEADAAPGAGQVRPGLEWLQAFVERHRDLIALLPVIVLLALIVLIAAWLWRSARSRAEEPLILTTALEEDPYAEAVVAAAAARPDPAPQQAEYHKPFRHSTREHARDLEDPVEHRSERRAAASSRTTPSPDSARAATAGGRDTARGDAPAEPRQKSASARSDSDMASAPDPYAQARSELERSRRAARAASGKGGPARSSAIAVVPAAAKQQSGAASPLKQTIEGEQDAGPQDLITALRGGDARHFEALLERLTGLSRRDVRELLRKAKPDELAIACRGIGLDQLAFASLVIMIRRHYLGEAEVPPHQLSNALAAFISTSPDEARSRLQSWSLDADFTSVDDLRDQGPATGFSYQV